MRKIVFHIVALYALLLFPWSVEAGELRLSAAASMKEAIMAVLSSFSEQHPEIVVVSNFGGSGSLAKQIRQGAPAELYISANRKWMDYLVQEGEVARQTVHTLVANDLVFIGKTESRVTGLEDIPTLSRIAIGSPRSVPAGQYAAQAMAGVGIYKEMEEAHKLVMAKDVRQALLYADRGEVDGAFVYGSDGQLARNCSILFTVPSKLHDPISYTMGLTTTGTQNSEALTLQTYLRSDKAIDILTGYGFHPPDN